MKQANCPSCGAEVAFKSSVSVFSVCGHCKSMIVRHDMDLESIGTMAQLPEDISPLKIGSRGKLKNSTFEIVGRLKVAWSEGYWNEWFLLFDDGKQGWLAEAMGFFMLSFEVMETSKVPAAGQIEVGKGYELVPSRMFFVDDIKEAVCIGSEGELPFKGLQGRRTKSIDLSDNTGKFAAIEYSEQDGISLYIGRYVDFASLQFTNLRDLASEIKTIRAADVFKCPSCGGPFSMMTPGLTASAACKYCGSIIDTTNRELTVLQEAERKMPIKPLIPIGEKGTLFGTKWEVTGFVMRTDESGVYSWDEYLLFNPYKGFRWLTTYKGHWNFVEMLRDRSLRGKPGEEVKFGGKSFKKFLTGQGKVFYVLGEFYWRIRKGETVSLADYIAPPEILSCEWDSSETNWSLGKYMEPEEVAAAFGLREEMPKKVGVAANQVNPHRQGLAWKVFLIFAACLTLLQVYFAINTPGKDVYHGSFNFDIRAKAETFVTPSFEVPGGTGNLEAVVFSDLNNDWLEANVTLVDEKTNKSTEFTQVSEAYSGVEDGESWSEDNRKSTALLYGVQGGRYHLVIQPVADISKVGAKSFSVNLRRGVTVWSTYLVALLLLALYPMCVCSKSAVFEQQRNQEGDAAATGEDGDEE